MKGKRGKHKATDVLTTGEVARVCGVSTTKVGRWIDEEFLKGFKVPGGVARRVMRKDLAEFMAKHKVPLDRLEQL